MRFGAHLPQIGWGDERFTLDRLTAVATTAERLGFDTITANDHLVYGRPWLDGPVALAAILSAAPRMRLMTSVSLPVVRGPIALAKALGAIDLLSGGRLDAGVGPGSSAADHAIAGTSFDDRWVQFDEAVRAMRSVWKRDAGPFVGRYYDTTDVALLPRPAQPDGPPIFVGSWGSPAGLRRVARLGDGWLASGYNTTPASFISGRATLSRLLESEQRDPDGFPTVLATTWMHVTDDDAAAHATIERLSAMLRREPADIAAALPIGSPSKCIDLFGRYREAGVDRMLLWPVVDEVEQLERVAADVIGEMTLES